MCIQHRNREIIPYRQVVHAIAVVLRATSITVNIRLIPMLQSRRHHPRSDVLRIRGRTAVGHPRMPRRVAQDIPITRVILPPSVHIQGIHQAVQRVSGQGAEVHLLTQRHAGVGIPIIPVIHQPSVRIQGIKRLSVQRIGGRVVAGQLPTRQPADAVIPIIPVIRMQFRHTTGISQLETESVSSMRKMVILK